MNSFVLTTVVTLLFISCTSALPNAISSILEKNIDIALPENAMIGQNQRDLGIEVCPDQLHLCPETADCCQKEDGKWYCCPKSVVPGSSYPVIYLILYPFKLMVQKK
ncbi:hypothetical protein AVEN_234559-1 [Araneus ventricosus]|uniref:Granulins domain-containing protein n=1 Tax=Araneus ventricosus TaxID=182803 RepID=A0A4Y2ABJ2_ARAVE|nr:hypothetical protein AVEN_234559-1 [Araneus ventricosus]